MSDMNDPIRIRACIAVVDDGQILLVPHYDTDRGPIQWCIPGGSVKFGELVRNAALREFTEETGLIAEIASLLDVTEVLKVENHWHSVTITFLGVVIGGNLKSEVNHPYGKKVPRWFSHDGIANVECHPKTTIEKALFYEVKKEGS